MYTKPGLNLLGLIEMYMMLHMYGVNIVLVHPTVVRRTTKITRSDYQQYGRWYSTTDTILETIHYNVYPYTSA